MLRTALPELEEPGSPVVLPTDSLAQGVERIPDVLCDLPRAQLRVDIQHQRTDDRQMALRLVRVHSVLAEVLHREALPRQLIHLVVHQSPRPWRASTTLTPPTVVLDPKLEALFHRQIYRVLALHQIGPQQLHRAPPPAALAVSLLRDAATLADRPTPAERRRPSQHHERIWALVITHAATFVACRREGGAAAIEPFLGYLYDIAQQPPGAAVMSLLQYIDPDLADDELTYTERIQKEAEARGEARGEARAEARAEARGEARGRVRTAARILRQQLTLRFGEPPPEAEAWMEHASAEHLEHAALRVFSLSSWRDLLTP